MERRYDSIIVEAPMEFDYIFKDLCKIDYKEVLCQYSREKIINLAMILNNNFWNKPAIELCNMLSNNDPNQINLKHRIESFLRSKSQSSVKYIVGVETTSLEILRRAFSIPFEEFNNEGNSVNVDQLQYDTIKLITQINGDLMKYDTSQDDEDFSTLIYTNNASSFDILHFNKQNEYIAQLIQAEKFFQLLEGNSKYNILLEAFYKKYKISNWSEYLRTLIAVFCLVSEEGMRRIAKDLSIYSSIMKRSVLDELSIPFSYNMIPYTSKDEYDQNGNSDYRFFRDKPLFKDNDGNYLIYSLPLLTDRIYSSLYFDFRNIAKGLKGAYPDIGNLFTSEFIEKTLFVNLMRDSLSSHVIDAFDENALKEKYEIKDGDLGSPDYYIKIEDAVILFECKDIRINAWVKEQRDFATIKQELRNKLVCKTYKIDYKNRCHKSVTPKRIGCGQIAGHVANIRNGKFPWDLNLPRKIRIYPVLVIADNRLLADGIACILQKYYVECLQKENLNPYVEKPLILMSPLTLIKYSKLFREDGIHKYFDEYYRHISLEPRDMLSKVNKLISFDDYMSQFPFNLNGFAEQIIKKISQK